MEIQVVSASILDPENQGILLPVPAFLYVVLLLLLLVFKTGFLCVALAVFMDFL